MNNILCLKEFLEENYKSFGRMNYQEKDIKNTIQSPDFGTVLTIKPFIIERNKKKKSGKNKITKEV